MVVSEETGGISVAERGQLHRMESIDHLRRFLAQRLLSEATGQTPDREDGGFSDERSLSGQREVPDPPRYPDASSSEAKAD